MKPLVTIGVPVYNGARLLRDALDSLVAQDYTELEIIVSDNASTDETPTIVAEYAKRDRRIRLARQSRNIGATENFNALVGMAKGEYFGWAAHDDLRAPTHVSALVAALQANPHAVAAQSRVACFYEEPSAPAFVRTNPLGDQHDPRWRFRTAIRSHWWTLVVFGLMRTDVLRKTGLIPTMIGGDKVLVTELALRGEFAEVPETLFFYRDAPVYDAAYERKLRATLAIEQRSRLHEARRLGEKYLALAIAADVDRITRVGLLDEIARWFVRYYLFLPGLQTARAAFAGIPGADRLIETIRATGVYRRLLDPFGGPSARSS